MANKGIIYLMTTAVPGLIKIGKTGIGNYEQRMYILEQNGYRNVTGLKRAFAIEVDNYSDKEALLDEIFEKSRVADTELFAIDINIVTQLLSSFDGTVIYPVTETKEEIFVEASENVTGKQIPDGTYTFERKKKSDNRTVKATAVIKNGCWTLLEGSIVGITECVGVSQIARELRASMPVDENTGKVLEDINLGACSPSFAGSLVMNQSINGWTEWKNSAGEPVDIYRNKNN